MNALPRPTIGTTTFYSLLSCEHNDGIILRGRLLSNGNRWQLVFDKLTEG